MKRLCRLALVLIIIGLVCGVTGAVLGGSGQGFRLFSGQINSAVEKYLNRTRSEYCLNDTDNIRSLELDIDAASVAVKQGEKWAVSSNIKDKYLSCKVKNDTLMVSMKDNWNPISFPAHKTPKIEVTVPKKTGLEQLTVNADAADLQLYDPLTARTVSIDADAASVEMNELRTEKLDIDCDAASVTGSVERMRGGKWDCDAGSIELTLLGELMVSDVYGDGEFSSIEIDGEEFDDKFRFRLGAKTGGTLELKCDVGSIEITTER